MEPDEIEEPRRWRLRTKLLIAFGVAAAAVILAVVLVPKRQYALLLTERLVSQARAAGLNVVVTEPEFSLTGISAKQVSVFVPKIIATFNFAEVRVGLSALGILAGSFNADASAKIFGGSIAARVSRGFSGGRSAVSFEATGIRLANAPQFQAFGVESGILALQLTEAGIDDKTGLTGGAWTISIQDLTKAQDTFIQLPPKAGGGFLAIPAVRGLKLDATGRLSATEITVDRAATTSSLGSAEMHGTAGLTGVGLLSFSGNAKLSPESQKKYGPFLPMASNNQVPADATDLALHLNGTVRRPQLLIQLP